MKVILVTLVLVGSAAAAPTIAKPVALPLPGGDAGIGFDDLRYSPELGKVLAPAGKTGLAFIDDKRAITRIEGFGNTTSADVGAGLVFASDREKQQVAVVDPKAGKVTSTAKLAAGPDYVRWVAPQSEVWVTEPRTKQIEWFALDGGKLVKKGAITVAGGPESLVIDAARKRAYTHTWDSETVVLDLAKHAEVARWKNGCAGSRGIALDEPRGLLFVGCDEGKATALDVTTGKVVGTAATGKGVDIIAYAPKLAHLYVPGGDSATLTILGVGKGGTLSVLGAVAAAEDAHCVTADEAGHAYVCDPKHGALLVVTDPFPATK